MHATNQQQGSRKTRRKQQENSANSETETSKEKASLLSVECLKIKKNASGMFATTDIMIILTLQ